MNTRIAAIFGEYTAIIFLVAIISGFVYLAFSRHKSFTKLKDSYFNALANKKKADAIRLGREYYQMVIRGRNKLTAIELKIANDLKMYDID